MDEATKRKIAEKRADAQRKREAKLQQEQQQQQQPDEPDWDDMVEETMEEPGMEDENAGMFDEFEEEAETTTSTSKLQEQVTATSSHAPLNNPPPSSSTSSFTPAPTNPPPPVTLPSSTPDIYSFSHYNPDTAYRAFKTLETESGKTKENLVMKKKLMEKHKKRESEKARTEEQIIRMRMNSSALSLLPPTPKPILGSVPTNLPNQPTLGVPSFTVKLLNGSIVHVPITASSTTPAPKVEIQQQPTGGLLSESMAVLSKIVEEEDRQKIHAASLPPKPSKASSPLANSNNSQLWVDKYSPQTFSDLLSDSKTNREVLRTLRAWDPYVFKKPKPARPTSSNNSFFAPAADEENPDPNDKRPHVNLRVILLCGPPGVGKTTLAHIIAGLAGYRVVEVNASDERTGGVLKERVLNAMESRTLSFEKGAESKPNCVILDEVDGADNKSTIQSLVNIIKQPMPATSSSKSAPYLQRPIIFICNHRFAPSLKPLLPYARIFDLNSPPPAKLLNRLKKICSFESLVAPPLVLSNLMTKSNGDIRSCLHTLQFVATKCRAASDSKTVDISNALNGSFGNGMKDRRSDMSSLQNTIFMKRTAKANKSQGHNSQVKEIFTAMDAYNDDNKTLDCMFSNVGRVSYLDPNFSRTAVAREFLSFASVNHMCVPVSAAAINVLCAVETKPDLVFNSKEDWEFRFARDKNLGLCKQFIDGLQITSRLGTFEAVSDLVPAALNMLAASTGTNSLNRVVSTVSMLNKVEKKAFDQKVGILRTLGLTYVRADQSGVTDDGVMGDEMVLSPRINKLVNFYGSEERREIPNVTREMVAYEAKVVGMRLREGNAAEFTRFKEKEAEVVEEEEKKEAAVEVRKAKENTFTQPSFASPKAKTPLAKPQAPRSAEVTPPKATTFLTGLAGISKKAKNARRAASVGFAEKKAKSKKLSHSGSGELLDQVIKFKHQKGFTQAVRISSKMGDFMC